MLKIREGRLSREVREALVSYQADVDGQSTYAARVDRAKQQFSRRNRLDNPVFVAVKSKLARMCNGSRRCMYCEDSVADEVEHFHPKDLYPEFVFVWRNYLYACGPCNGPKNNQFGVVGPTADEIVVVTRQRNSPVVPPIAGSTALINPLRENPLDFFMLDIRNTFEFTPISESGTIDRLRADYTLKVLRLNERDYLIDARRHAYSGFLARLEQYVQHLRNGASPRKLALLRSGIQRSPHPTVWEEMKRQHVYHSTLSDLFAQAPETLEF